MVKPSFKQGRRRPAKPVWSNNAVDTRKRAILREAAGCFNQKGYHGTTIEDIADRVNVTKAAVYYYVKNKEELLFECHQIALDIGMEGLRLAQEKGGGPDDMLATIFRHYIEGVTDKLQGTVVLLEEGMLTPRHFKEVVARRDEFERQVRALVRTGIDQGIFAPRDPKLAVFAMLGAANWISKWYSPQGERSAQEIARIITEYLVAGLLHGAGERPAANGARNAKPAKGQRADPGTTKVRLSTPGR
jgi:TetR/AcrR family transcriptional regulator